VHTARLTLCLFVCGLTAASAQQAPAPNPPQPSSPPVTRNAHSTQADLAVPLCPPEFDDSLVTDGIVGKPMKGVTPPEPRFTPEAEFSKEARHLKIAEYPQGFLVILRLVVDVKGKPTDICLARSAGFGLDANAARAVRQYQFRPAKKDRKSVASRISVEVNFRWW
jgi:TonB family protein